MSAIVKTYFDAFNAGDIDGMLACLTDDVAHHVNEGQVRVGKELFRTFCQHMSATYREKLTDMVIFQTGDRAAAEYIVNGTYLQTDDGAYQVKKHIDHQALSPWLKNIQRFVFPCGSSN